MAGVTTVTIYNVFSLSYLRSMAFILKNNRKKKKRRRTSFPGDRRVSAGAILCTIHLVIRWWKKGLDDAFYFFILLMMEAEFMSKPNPVQSSKSPSVMASNL